MRGLLGPFAAVLVIAGSAAVARADEIHVPGDFRRLQDALSAASPGDTVVLRRGTHRGTFRIDEPGVTLRGEAGARIRGPRRGHGGGNFGTALEVRAAGVTVTGVTFVQGGVEAGPAGTGTGDGFVLEDCTFLRRASDSGATTIYVFGHHVRILRNRLELRGRRENQSAGIFVSGLDAEVSGNTIGGRVRWRGAVRVIGSRSVVEANHVGPVSGQGIVVLGDAGTLAGNDLEGANLESWGGDALVTGNTTIDAPAGLPSIWVNGTGNVVEDNESTSPRDTGLLVWGNGNTLRRNRVFRAGSDPEGRTPGHGIVVRGSGNALFGNFVEGAAGEGIRIAGSGGQGWDRHLVRYEPTGVENAVTDSSATGAGSCGLGNWVAGTSVTGSTFVGNGVDVVDGQGFSAFDGNLFDTGGPGWTGAGVDDGPVADYGVEGEFLGGD